MCTPEKWWSIRGGVRVESLMSRKKNNNTWTNRLYAPTRKSMGDHSPMHLTNQNQIEIVFKWPNIYIYIYIVRVTGNMKWVPSIFRNHMISIWLGCAESRAANTSAPAAAFTRTVHITTVDAVSDVVTRYLVHRSSNHAPNFIVLSHVCVTISIFCHSLFSFSFSLIAWNSVNLLHDVHCILFSTWIWWLASFHNAWSRIRIYSDVDRAQS